MCRWAIPIVDVCRPFRAREGKGECIEGSEVQRVLLILFEPGINEVVVAVSGSGSQFIAAVIFRIGSMALDPYKFNVVFFVEIEELKPKIFVFFAFELLLYPTENPFFFDGIDDIFTIGMDEDIEGVTREGLEGYNNAHQFHTVVGGQSVGTTEFLARAFPYHDDAVASGAGIAARGTVGVDMERFQGVFLLKA